MIHLLEGMCLGLGFAIFFPEPFTKIKTWVLKVIKKLMSKTDNKENIND